MSGPRPQPALLVVAAVLAATACGQGGSVSGKKSFPSIAPLPTVEQVYAQAQRALRAGGVYHEKITTNQVAGEFSFSAQVERWTDAAHGRAREQVRVSGRMVDEVTGQAQVATRLTVGKELWQEGGEIVPAPVCHGADAATSGVLGCPVDTGGPVQITVAWGASGGKPVLTLTAKVHAESEDATADTTDVVSLDPSTMLPTSTRRDGTMNGGPIHSRSTVVGSFLSGASLAKGFFDPASMGWKRAAPVASLPSQAKVYWLGTGWNPGGRLPELVLHATEPGGDSGYDAVLVYAKAADRYRSPPVIMIQLWRRAVWDSQRVDITAARCGAQPVKVLAGSAALYCPEPGQVSAFVTLPDAVLWVDAPLAQDGDKVITNAFGTVAAMTTVLHALRAK